MPAAVPPRQQFAAVQVRRYRCCFPRKAANTFLPSCAQLATLSRSDGVTRTARVPGLLRYDPHDGRLLCAGHAGMTYQSNLTSAAAAGGASFTCPPAVPLLGQPQTKHGGPLWPVAFLWGSAKEEQPWGLLAPPVPSALVTARPRFRTLTFGAGGIIAAGWDEACRRSEAAACGRLGSQELRAGARWLRHAQGWLCCCSDA